MMEEKFKKNGKIFFDLDEIPKRNTQAIQTLTEVINCYNENSAQDEEFNQRRNEAVDDLKAICFKTFGSAANVYIFGSCINGFGTKSSDVDCFVMSNFDLNRKNSYYNPLFNSLKKSASSPFRLTNFVRRGNHPILTVKHKRNGMELDITFSSNYDPRQDVLENSALLNTYAQKNVKIASVGRFIKYVLSKEPSLGSAKIGGLSSYSHIIMFIYYLLHGKHRIRHVVVSPPYINREEVIEASEGEIFLDFLRFYACELDSSLYAIDIRDFDVKKIKSNPKSDPTIFTLEDPIIEKNLGKTMSAKRVYELKVFYYHLLCTLSNHKMNESQLMAFINELGEQKLPERKAPRLHPFCDPDKEDPKPPRDRKRQDRQRGRGAPAVKTGESSDQVLKAAPQAPVEGSSNTNTQATGKNNTSRRNKRKNKKKVDAPIPREHDQEASIVPEGDIFLQNDPYLLEDMMKEIELPEKETLPNQENRPKKPMVDIKSETAKLAKAMLEESKRLETKEHWNVVSYLGSDVMGDSRCLVAVPLLATLGFTVPAIQAGNNVSLEKLKCIPGFNPELKLEDMNSMLEKVGCFAGYSQDLNLVESKMNTILKSVETLKSNQLDLARQFSLLAACGITHVFGDVGCVGKGKRDPAFERAKDITNLTKSLGIKCRVHVSDATVPYSTMLGYPLEIRDVVTVLGGEGSSDVVDILSLQCAHLLQMTEKVESLKDGKKMVIDALASGEALTKFLEMLEAQGVSRDTTDKLRERKFDEVFPVAPHQTKIEARFSGRQTGIIRDIRLDQLERVVKDHLGGYGNSGQGIEIAVEIGSKVSAGSCLAVVHHSKDTLTSKQKGIIQNTAFDIEKIHFNRVVESFRNDWPDKKRKNRNSKSGSRNEADTDKLEVKDEVKDEVKEGVSSTTSTDSVPKDYVVVVNTENGDDQRTVIEKKE